MFGSDLVTLPHCVRAIRLNTFNRNQLDGSGSVDGNINDKKLGHAMRAAPPRNPRVALKFLF